MSPRSISSTQVISSAGLMSSSRREAAQCLGLPHRGGGGDELPVQIGEIHLVTVGQQHGAHTAAADPLRRSGADASQPQHRYPAAGQTLHCLLAHQQAGPCQPIGHGIFSFHTEKGGSRQTEAACVSNKTRRAVMLKD